MAYFLGPLCISQGNVLDSRALFIFAVAVASLHIAVSVCT